MRRRLAAGGRPRSVGPRHSRCARLTLRRREPADLARTTCGRRTGRGRDRGARLLVGLAASNLRRVERPLSPEPGLRAQPPPSSRGWAGGLRPAYLVDLQAAGVTERDRPPVLGLRALQGVAARRRARFAATA